MISSYLNVRTFYYEYRERDEEFIDCGYVNVTGILCKVFDYNFVVPCPEDYPNKRFIAGKDFIFYFDRKTNKTWYKKVDLTDGEYRSNLFCIDDLMVTLLEVDESECSVNINKTAFVYPFVLDEDEFEARQLSNDIEFDRVGDELSCEVAHMIISGNISSKVDDFIDFLRNIDDLSLKPLPDINITHKFSAAFSDNNPVYFTNLRHSYMLMVLLSQRNFKFPYNMNLKQFKALVLA